MNKKQLLILPALFLSLLIGSTACVSLTLHELHRRAEQGDAQAQSRLGLAYQNGLGLAKDYKEAAKWYRLAADQGDSHAQAALGLAYQEGWGSLAKDYKEAVKWYRLAAEQGDPYAQVVLGNLHLMGEVVSRNYVRAYMWYKISLGISFDKNNEVRITRKTRSIVWKAVGYLEKKMTPAQIEEAQRLAKEWISAKTEKARELSEKCKAKNYKNC